MEGARRVWGVGEELVCGMSEGVVVLGVEEASGEVGVLERAAGGWVDEKTVACFGVPSGAGVAGVGGGVVRVQVVEGGVLVGGEKVWGVGVGGCVLFATIDSAGVVVADDKNFVRTIDSNGKVIQEFCVGEQISAIASCGTKFAIATWSSDIQIWSGGAMQSKASVGDDIVRSLEVVQSDSGEVSIICGLGSGKVSIYGLFESSMLMGDNELKLRQQVIVSHEPIQLRSCGSADLLLALAGTATKIDIEELHFSSLNTSFGIRDATMWNDYVVLLSDTDELKFCSIDEATTIEVRRVERNAVPGGFTPRRIALAGRSLEEGSKESMAVLETNSSDRIQSAECADRAIISNTHQLAFPGEIACSVCFHNGLYYIGTARSEEGGAETEPRAGAIRAVSSAGSIESKIATNGMASFDSVASTY